MEHVMFQSRTFGIAKRKPRWIPQRCDLAAWETRHGCGNGMYARGRCIERDGSGR